MYAKNDFFMDLTFDLDLLCQGHGSKSCQDGSRGHPERFPAIFVCDLELDLVTLTLTFQGQRVINSRSTPDKANMRST